MCGYSARSCSAARTTLAAVNWLCRRTRSNSSLRDTSEHLHRPVKIDLVRTELAGLLGPPLSHADTKTTGIDQRQHRVPGQGAGHVSDPQLGLPLVPLRPVPQVVTADADRDNILTHLRLTLDDGQLH